MKAVRREKGEFERLHRLRLLTGAARCLAERAQQDPEREAVKMLAYIEALAEIVEEALSTMAAEE